MKTRIYKTQISTPFGDFIFAVDTIEEYAKGDLRAAAMTAFNMPPISLNIKSVKRSNRRILDNMIPIKKCIDNNNYWGWFRKLK